MNSDEIERLRKRLFKKGETFKERELRSPLSSRLSEAKPYWEGSSPEEERLILPEKPSMPFFKKLILIALVVIGLIVLGVTIYFLIRGLSVVSGSNIEITLGGPSSIKGGELGNWQVSVTNKNKSDLELADLIIEYPEGAKPSIAPSGFLSGTKIVSERRSLGKIKAGETAIQAISLYLFGEKDTNKVFKFTIEYRPQGSNAILAKTAEQSVRLLQSPVEVSVKMPKETNTGEEITMEIEIISNANAVIKDVNLKIEYPAGFQYHESDLKPVSGDNVWRLGDIEPNKKRILKIKGILEGQDLMELVFRVSVGPLDAKGEVIAYGFNVQSIVLKKPFLKIGVKINNRTEEVAVSPGAELNVDIDWQNTVPEKVYNAVIEIKLNSSVVDASSITLSQGFYRSFDQTLVWNKSSSPDLAEIEPLQEGDVSFRFAILDSIPNDVIRKGNATVSLDIQMKAERDSADQGRIQVTNHLIKDIKIATIFQLSQRGLYYSGAFKNSGPLPPKVGKETTYTIVWSLTNSSNAVSDATVSAFLPSYIRWLGVIKPETAEISYNSTTGEIFWKAGNIPAGTGIIDSAREAAFQISFLPDSSQVDSKPVLVSEAILGGKDNFTGAFLRKVKAAITTYLDTDPQFKYNEGTVVK
ncbi:MAG: hypothetical protein CO056_02560 [Candidatus Tagabacteria bacterium CG_4_9_14_0_2_um_filter_41_11]|uniref:DUF11 domain-containing protein n=3 Tax=Candidatus Tagaibacteriota TaxID=1817918 RepID=A0A2M8G8F6_9BACT|nr:MAG: hypothetical protein COS58_01860 [Candidatus Tagabacteria bacterium CG03_land_8_20_14_0_80_41_22]PJC25009.1 MAG: hypothetical protein CO056_02560 [Candidatus Tagabacteria bacterium CG_4_9_14_0_2_um_filter_41_11]PJC69610.1 MAG: hypothetical protein CO014_02370 [Candidatus Tagabacteria bacterium CG_4_8_14_3_um_filter_41_8]